MPYTIEDHSHRFAAWAAATAASASKLCRFGVQTGVAILETSGFTSDFGLNQLPPAVDLDHLHGEWRATVIKNATDPGLAFTHGVAAKLINCYLKVRFVCAGAHNDNRVQALHPPIDEVLLRGLARVDFGGHAKLWRKFHKTRWSKFDSSTYQDVIDLIRESLPPGEPLWKIEEHWKGHQ